MRGLTTGLVGLIGGPSIAGSRSPRMHNAAFAALGLDLAYVLLPVTGDRVFTMVRGLAAAGFVGANVTIPHKRVAAEACDEADGESVNTLVVTGDRLVGLNTDREILRGIEPRCTCLIGAGGAAAALEPALRGDVRRFSRAGAWPPDAAGCDLVVNATPVTDELLVAPVAGQTVVDLAYRADGRPTALVEAAVEAGCQVVDGYEALVRQGAASFERWTGVPAPLDVMRSAARSRDGATS